jgi:hypothetical protein
MWVLSYVAGRWVKVLAEAADGGSLWEEKACLDCQITKNRLELGSQGVDGFIHHL